MKIICNEYKIDSERLTIEHDIVNDNYYFSITDLKTFKVTHQSEAIAHLISCRAKAFEFMGIQTS